MSYFCGLCSLDIKHLTPEFLESFNQEQASCNTMIFSFKTRLKKQEKLMVQINNEKAIFFVPYNNSIQKIIYKKPKLEIKKNKLYISCLNPIPLTTGIWIDFDLISFELIRKNMSYEFLV